MKMKNFILTLCLLGLTAGVYQPKADAGLLDCSGTIALGMSVVCGGSL